MTEIRDDVKELLQRNVHQQTGDQNKKRNIIPFELPLKSMEDFDNLENWLELQKNSDYLV